MKQNIPLCIVCGAICEIETQQSSCVELDHKDVIIGPLYGGVICEAKGNYGSTAYDPMGGRVEDHLFFVLCDECFEKKREHMLKPVVVSSTIDYKELYEDLLKKQKDEEEK